MEVDDEVDSTFGQQIADCIQKGICFLEDEDFTNAFVLLEDGKKLPTTKKAEAWFYELCIKTWNIKKKVLSDGLDCSRKGKEDLFGLINEAQGSTCSLEGSVVEIYAICNLLSLEMSEMKYLSPNHGLTLNANLCSSIIFSLKKVKTSAGVSFHEQAKMLSKRPICNSKEILTALFEASRCVQNLNGELSMALSVGLLVLSFQLMTIADAISQDALIKKLALVNIEVARKLKSQNFPRQFIATGALLQETNVHDLEYQTTLIAGLTHYIIGEKNAALSIIDSSKGSYEENQLSQLLKACILLNSKDFANSSYVAQKLCTKLKQEGSVGKSLLLNLAWNIAGICFFEMKKPNIAAHIFERSIRSSSENLAPLKNLLVTLKVLGQHDTRIECLKQALRLSKEVIKMDSQPKIHFAFERIFLMKICQLENSGMKSLEVSEKLNLFSQSLDEMQLLQQLADSLYEQRRFKEASYVYLDLIRKFRNGSCSQESETKIPRLMIYHHTQESLLKGGLYGQGIVVCNYILQFNDNIKTWIVDENGNKINLDGDIVSLIYKSELLRSLGEKNEMAVVVKRILSSLERENEFNDPLTKRPRIAETIPFGSCSFCTLKLNELKAALYNNLGIALASEGEKKEALDAFMNAVKFMKDPYEEDILFNYCKLLMELNLENISLRNWNDFNNEKESLMSLRTKFLGCFKARQFSSVSAKTL